jgi:hypothetical protein
MGAEHPVPVRKGLGAKHGPREIAGTLHHAMRTRLESLVCCTELLTRTAGAATTEED